MNNFTLGVTFSYLTLLSSFAVLAQSTESPQLDWANMFDGTTSAGDQSQAVAVVPNSDGGVYWHNIGNSTESARDISYAGEVLFEGVPYNAGNSNNGNLCIIKTNSDGTAIWNLHSGSCDFANDGSIATTSDGGAVFTARLRHTDGMLDSPISIVDGTGKTHNFDWKVERRYYRVMVGRLAPDGSLLWSRFIDCDTSPAPSASGNYAEFTAEAISVPALALDNAGNIYIGGNFRSNLHVPTAEGEKVISPRNVSTWNGDPQQSAGGMYILKLNSDGYYLADLPVEGNAQNEAINRLLWNDGSLYFQALVIGNDDTISIAGQTFTPEGDFTPVLGRLDSDFNPSWITPLKGEKLNGKYGFQNCGISVCDHNLWFTGMFNGTVSAPDSTPFFASTQANMREGFLAKIDAATGGCVKGVSSRDSFSDNILTGYLCAIQNPYAPSKVYVYGYGMNANMGVFLRPYDASTLEADADNAWTLASQGGVPSAIACAYDINNEALYFTARGNKPFKCEDTTIGDNSTWAVLMAKYNLPESSFPTIVESVSEDTSSLEIVVSRGELIFNSTSPCVVNVFDITGRLVASPLVDRLTSLPLAPGLYIAAGRRFLVK